MNIKSKNGSITISGTDVKVGNDLDLSAKKDITIKASEENFTSSSSSSQSGISLSMNLEEGRLADLSISKAGTNGRGNGTKVINKKVMTIKEYMKKAHIGSDRTVWRYE